MLQRDMTNIWEIQLVQHSSFLQSQTSSILVLPSRSSRFCKIVQLLSCSKESGEEEAPPLPVVATSFCARSAPMSPGRKLELASWRLESGRSAACCASSRGCLAKLSALRDPHLCPGRSSPPNLLRVQSPKLSNTRNLTQFSPHSSVSREAARFPPGHMPGSESGAAPSIHLAW